MADKNKSEFDLIAFLSRAGLGRRIVGLKDKDTFFSQGDSADSIFYLQHGRAKLTIVSQNGKEATITLLSAVTLLARLHSRRCMGCVCPRRPR